MARYYSRYHVAVVYIVDDDGARILAHETVRHKDRRVTRRDDGALIVVEPVTRAFRDYRVAVDARCAMRSAIIARRMAEACDAAPLDDDSRFARRVVAIPERSDSLLATTLPAWAARDGERA